MPDAELERILAPSYLDELPSLPTEDLRTRRADCEAAEEAVSYARRLVQGRLDIVRAELLRRDDGGDAQASSLLASLPAILSHDESPTAPERARSTRVRVPPGVERFEADVEAVVSDEELDGLDLQDASRLAEVAERLGRHEHELSTLRRELFRRIDALRDELAERYKDGRADIGEILRR